MGGRKRCQKVLVGTTREQVHLRVICFPRTMEFHIMFVSLFFLNFVRSQNVSHLYNYFNPPDTYHGYGAGAIGGLMPTCLLILCGAVIRILQIYRQKNSTQHLRRSEVNDQASNAATIRRPIADDFTCNEATPASNYDKRDKLEEG